MRNLNQNTEQPNTLVQHCATPIAPTLSTQKGIESTFSLFDSLALKTLFTKARSRVSKDTKQIISISRLREVLNLGKPQDRTRFLTATSNGKESHLFSEVKVSVPILTYKAMLISHESLPSQVAHTLSFSHPARSL